MESLRRMNFRPRNFLCPKAAVCLGVKLGRFLALCLPALAMAASVVLPDGSPAEGAKALPLVKAHFVRISDGAFEGLFDSESPITVPADGTLAVSPETAGRWIILHERGWADATLSGETAEVILRPWESVNGKVAAPSGGSAMVRYERSERARERNEIGGAVFWTSRAPIAADGRFCIGRVPSGPGKIGLLRELANGRGTRTWIDFPRAVDIPASAEIELGGGTTVRGKIGPGWASAALTLIPEAPAPAYYGSSDKEGHFSIPGVLPGEYSISARAGDGASSLASPARTIHVGDRPVDIGEIPGNDPDIDVDRRAELPEGLEDRIREIAAKHASAPIEKIWIGELMHPLGNYGARVTCSPLPDAADPTWATRRILLISVPGETVRKFYPEHDSLGFGFRFAREPSDEVRSIDSRVRVFPLQKTTLYLALEEGTDYAEALSLLRAIEGDEILRPKPAEKIAADGNRTITMVGGLLYRSPEVLPQIDTIRKQPDGLYEVRTREAAFRGAIYTFEKTAEGFLLRGSSRWVS